eukprot:scaffold6278_cov105-Cylindrotheca_fusiformis.AAC.5
MMTLTEDQPDVRVASQGFVSMKCMMTLTEDQPDVRVASQGFASIKLGHPVDPQSGSSYI